MLTLAKLISVMITAWGISFLVYPALMKHMLRFWQEGKRIYGAGAIRILIGGLFILCAPASHHPNIVGALGIFFFIAGILLFMMGAERLKGMIAWWHAAPPLACRAAGLALTVFGLFIFSLL